MKNCCPKCDYELKKESKFCTSCGYKLNTFEAISTMNLSVSENSIDDEIALSRFRFVNWLDFIQYQQFSNIEAEQAFKILYYCFIFLSDLFNNSDDFIKNRFKDEHTQILEQIPEKLCGVKENEIPNVVKFLKRRLFKNNVDYRWLFIAEIVYTYKFLNIEFNNSNSDYNRLWNFLGITKEKKINLILSCIKNPAIIKNKKIRKSFIDIEKFVASQHKYLTQKVFNIAVCANMSAGKSTFVNALLGADYLPSRNEATTACITSVYDNDLQTKMIGFVTSKDEILEISDNLLLENIDKWNSYGNNTHIYLQSDLDDISSNQVICAVHDTPGTNNSGDKTHHDITMNFLNSTKLAAIVFVVNAEHVSTTDEKTLLSEIYTNKICRDKTPIIFVLNKADCIDNEKEDIFELISKYKDYLNDIGFENPKILPVSAKAARLLKMASKRKSNNFSKMEQREFALCLSEFLEDYDFSSNDGVFETSDSIISIGQKEYSRNEILTALNRTGINAIEKEIESLF